MVTDPVTHFLLFIVYMIMAKVKTPSSPESSMLCAQASTLGSCPEPDNYLYLKFCM